ncbi:MAG: hypothetical protein GY820_31175, partial [Gammaproteobacteria bacterium]|nr:hypothetical protein [Gammaproteobacteria bacterium]
GFAPWTPPGCCPWITVTGVTSRFIHSSGRPPRAGLTLLGQLHPQTENLDTALVVITFILEKCKMGVLVSHDLKLDEVKQNWTK